MIGNLETATVIIILTVILIATVIMFHIYLFRPIHGRGHGQSAERHWPVAESAHLHAAVLGRVPAADVARGGRGWLPADPLRHGPHVQRIEQLGRADQQGHVGEPERHHVDHSADGAHDAGWDGGGRIERGLEQVVEFVD